MNLYRRSWLRASAVLLLACFALTLSAANYQRGSTHKLRATALLELTTDQSGTVTTQLLPITILANGSFHDATIYESRPRPMALGTGVVYEAQKTGVPVGYVTINNSTKTLSGWVGQGKWQPARDATQASSTPKPPAPPKPAPGDDRPILHREGENTPSSEPTQPSQPSTPSSDDRPVLHRSTGESNQQPAANTQSQSQTQSQPESQPDVPDDPNRPVLRRRKPPTADETDNSAAPPAPKTQPSATPPSQAVSPKPAPAITPGTRTLVAVSDAQTSDSRSYEFHWKIGEREQIEAKMRKLALGQLPGEAAQLDEHALTNVVIRSFDLDLSNDAVVVITAEVPGGYLAPQPRTARGKTAARSEAGKFVSRYITVIARVDFDGNPQKIAASVTDSSRLDVAPRLELVDAVDVDGDGLAELLFREYDFDQTTFLIYGVGHGTVTKVFEGASVPLK
ncbi:MAG TPA: hypothetical protein VJA94_02590 [Candidatus Angelobacter sp.]